MDDWILLRVPEAATRLSLSPATVRELIKSGELPAVRIGKAVRVPVKALDAFVRRAVSESAP